MYTLLSSFCVIGLLLFGLISCRSVNYVGQYELRHFPKTSIELKEDGTFSFTKINPNPYLHPFDHPDEYYFTTTGQWEILNQKLILNSSKDSLASQSPEIVTDTVLEDQTMDTTINIDGQEEIVGHSSITFIDIFNDTVNVLSIQLPNGDRLSRLHRSMRYADWFTQLSDTAEFHFYGYPPFTIIRKDKRRREMKVKLYPQYQNGVFAAKEFGITKRTIKDKKMKFRKK